MYIYTYIHIFIRTYTHKQRTVNTFKFPANPSNPTQCGYSHSQATCPDLVMCVPGCVYIHLTCTDFVVVYMHVRSAQTLWYACLGGYMYSPSHLQ